MAINTLNPSDSSAPMTGWAHLLKARLVLAEAALYEITCLSRVARSIDPEGEDLPQVLPGLMARIQLLSESVSDLIDGGKLDHDRARRIWVGIRSTDAPADEITKLVQELPAASETEIQK